MREHLPPRLLLTDLTPKTQTLSPNASRRRAGATASPRTPAPTSLSTPTTTALASLAPPARILAVLAASPTADAEPQTCLSPPARTMTTRATAQSALRRRPKARFRRTVGSASRPDALSTEGRCVPVLAASPASCPCCRCNAGDEVCSET